MDFTTPVGEKVFFDENGDPSASYDIINWHVSTEGKVEFIKVGQFDVVKGPEQDFQLDLTKIFWGGGPEDEVRMLDLLRLLKEHRVVNRLILYSLT